MILLLGIGEDLSLVSLVGSINLTSSVARMGRGRGRGKGGGRGRERECGGRLHGLSCLASPLPSCLEQRCRAVLHF
jgi:hypothetical protein